MTICQFAIKIISIQIEGFFIYGATFFGAIYYVMNIIIAWNYDNELNFLINGITQLHLEKVQLNESFLIMTCDQDS